MTITLAQLPINNEMYEIKITKDLYDNRIKNKYESHQIVSSIMSLGSDHLTQLNDRSNDGFVIDKENTFGVAFIIANNTIQILSIIQTQNIFQQSTFEFYTL